MAEVLRTSAEKTHASLIDLVEESLVSQALKLCNFNQVHTARMLGISRNTLRNRIQKYRLEQP